MTLIVLGLSEEYFRKEKSTTKMAVHSVPQKVQSAMVTQLMLSYLSFSERISGCNGVIVIFEWLNNGI